MKILNTSLVLFLTVLPYASYCMEPEKEISSKRKTTASAESPTEKRQALNREQTQAQFLAINQRLGALEAKFEQILASVSWVAALSQGFCLDQAAQTTPLPIQRDIQLEQSGLPAEKAASANDSELSSPILHSPLAEQAAAPKPAPAGLPKNLSSNPALVNKPSQCLSSALKLAHGNNTNFAKSLELLKPIACQTSDLKMQDKALLAMGNLHCRGDSTLQRKFSEALKCYKAASQSLDRDVQITAFVQMGHIYYIGDTTVYKYYSEALKYLKLAASNNSDPKITLLMGHIHYAGDSTVERDFSKALEYYTPSAMQTHDLPVQAWALYRLGSIYLLGDKTVQRNLDLALKNLKHAAEQSGDHHAKKSARELITLIEKNRLGVAIKLAEEFDRQGWQTN